MADTADCRTCVYFRGKSDEPDFLFRTCEIHRNIEVQLSLVNAFKPEDKDLVGYTIIDPTASYCGKYLVFPLADGLKGLFSGFKRRRKKKKGKDEQQAEEE